MIKDYFMKKIATSTLLLILSVNTFSQQIKLSTALNPDDFLKKSNRQKSTAIILLCSGAVISALIKIEKATMIQQSSQLEILYPAVSFKISL